MTRDAILAAVASVGTPRHTFRFIRRSPEALLAVLLDALGPTRSSFPTPPGYLRGCGIATNASGEKRKGPMRSCVDIHYATWMPGTGKCQCTAALGYIPAGAESKDWQGMRVCAFLVPESIRAQAVQSSPPDHTPPLTEPGRGYLDAWLLEALAVASRRAPEPIRAAALATRTDAFCTVEAFHQLGVWLHGFLEAARPWERRRR